MTRKQLLRFAKPILFNSAMVQAILEGRKTVTRRLVKWPDCEHIETDVDGSVLGIYDQFEGCVFLPKDCAPRCPGDLLYVRETFLEYKGKYYFRADPGADNLKKLGVTFKWKPSIHMPKEAARIFLRVTDVSLQRLQGISEIDILEKEGVSIEFPEPKPRYASPAYCEMILKPAVRKAFSVLWDSTVSKKDLDCYGWDANPWVWVIKFERVVPE